MKLASLCVLLITVTAQDISKSDSSEGRELHDYSNQEWKLDYPYADWFPRLSEAEDQPLRRRRIRKRKRRPPIEDQTEEITRRRLRPLRLDQIREPWEDMSEEINQKSYNRRRLTPIYDENEDRKIAPHEKIRDPFTALQEAEEKQKTTMKETSSMPDLKTILKQREGLSLSEVLQRQNLSLAELLKGNQQAISALVSKTETTTESLVETTKHYRPSKVIERNDDLTSLEVLDAQRRRLPLLHGHKDNNMFVGVTKYDVVTEETTDKRIFVPSNSKFYTSVDYKPLIVFKDITTTPTTPTKSRLRELPLTSAKLNKLTESTVTININELFGFKKNDSSDGPFKMTIDLEEIPTTEDVNLIDANTVPTVEIVEVSTVTSMGEKLKQVTAKEEIMEILKNPRDREYLSKILKSRNMTIEELVELRERGSSQLHLADIFHNKTREPEPEDAPFIGHISSNSVPFFNRKPKSRILPPPTTTQTDIVTTRPPYTITSFPTFKIETNKNFRSQPFLPVWKQLYPSFFSEVYENNYEVQSEIRSTVPTTTHLNNYDLDSVDDIENTLAEAANRKLHVLHQNVEDETFITLPSGVKSAILASLAIIGLSLLVFLTILVVFKWTQKQKGGLKYKGSFSGSRIRSPILEPEQRRSFKTFMAETLGKRKTNYYKQHLQSMSDSIWNDNEKKSYI